jgi:hypothetical protein
MGFTKLSSETQNYLENHPEIRLNQTALERLASYDADMQMKWLVNPLVAYVMECFFRNLSVKPIKKQCVWDEDEEDNARCKE